MQAPACSDLVDLAIANPGPVALLNLCIFREISRWGADGPHGSRRRSAPPHHEGSASCHLLGPHPEERPTGRVSKDGPRQGGRHSSAFPRRDSARGLRYSCPSEIRGRRECRVPNAPAALRAKWQEARTQVVTGTPDIPAFPARWFTTYSALSPVSGLFSHRRSAGSARET
jgi:hypothetical protein